MTLLEEHTQLDTGFDAEAVITRACTDKTRFDDPRDARASAREATRRSGEHIFAYRCPFGDGCQHHAHWHIGHQPSLEGLRLIARAIRERAR